MEKLKTGNGSVREIIHDLRNPLLSIRLNAEFLKGDNGARETEADELFISSCDSIVSEIERLECILNHLGEFAVEE